MTGAALTDFLDGLTARWLDPAADKLLLTASFVLLTDYPAMFQEIDLMHRIPIWLTILTVSRDVLIVSVALVMVLAFRTRRFPPSIWGKLTSTSELVTVGAYLLYNTMRWKDGLLVVLVWVTLALTLVSGFHYMARTIGTVGGQPSVPEDGPA